ncbi:MAG: hypothetical protein JXL80_08935 [Planctomycetes bacterium]|nr:hypothetical protein [Planctomycetota bacterium]
MKGHKTVITASLLLALCGAAVGCRGPLETYNKGRAGLIASHDLLVTGDRALVGQDYDAATDDYAAATSELTRAVSYLESAESSIENEIRAQDLQGNQLSPRPIPADDRSVQIGSRTVPVDRYYVDSLHAYRQSLALAVVMKTMALTREGESHYRVAAHQLHLADELYRTRQFNAAQQSYAYCSKVFRLASSRFAEAERFLTTWTADGERLQRAAAPGIWENVDPLRTLAGRRLKQSDAYLAATLGRSTLASRVVAAYQGRKPGDLPEVQIEPLPPLPQATRYSVQHPPIPRTDSR